MRISIINGPNLNLLGTRESSIYGSETFEQFLYHMQQRYPEHEFIYFQSNIEGEIINQIHASASFDAIIINAGAYTHTSIAIADALRAIPLKTIIEVHISQIFAREEYRHHSFIAPLCSGMITGFGMNSYLLAIESLLLTKN